MQGILLIRHGSLLLTGHCALTKEVMALAKAASRGYEENMLSIVMAFRGKEL
jgi:hypothetical protein